MVARSPKMRPTFVRMPDSHGHTVSPTVSHPGYFRVTMPRGVRVQSPGRSPGHAPRLRRDKGPSMSVPRWASIMTYERTTRYGL